MYINYHPYVGRLIPPDHRRNLQALLSQYYEEILDMKGASGAVQIRELKFRKSVEPPLPSPLPLPDISRYDNDAYADAEGVRAMPMAGQSPNSPPSCAGGAWGCLAPAVP
jgi:hypothetical protein